jgi:hypothetical protein
MTPTTVRVPLRGGPANGQDVRCVIGPDGRPPLTHAHRAGLAEVATYELVAEEGGEGWRYEFTPRADSGSDFAPEHRSPTLADQMPGGPEGRPEDDSPRGLAGAD